MGCVGDCWEGGEGRREGGGARGKGMDRMGKRER